MKQQNDINKQFSENNNKIWSSYVTLIGSFIVIFGVYINEYPTSIVPYQFESGKLLFMTIVVMIVLAFLTALSSTLGYSRRRDHVVSCASSPNDSYSRICGNGRDKCLCNYLLGAYGYFFYGFCITALIFLLFSAFIFIKNAPVWQRWVVCVFGTLSFIIPLALNHLNYCHYTKICKQAERYEEKRDLEVTSSTSGISSVKTITIDINC